LSRLVAASDTQLRHQFSANFDRSFENKVPISIGHSKRFYQPHMEGVSYAAQIYMSGRHPASSSVRYLYLDDRQSVEIFELRVRGLHYATQKPLALLDRIIKASCNENDTAQEERKEGGRTWFYGRVLSNPSETEGQGGEAGHRCIRGGHDARRPRKAFSSRSSSSPTHRAKWTPSSAKSIVLLCRSSCARYWTNLSRENSPNSRQTPTISTAPVSVLVSVGYSVPFASMLNVARDKTSKSPVIIDVFRCFAFQCVILLNGPVRAMSPLLEPTELQALPGRVSYNRKESIDD
jgi:hypothetical protein